MQIGDYKLFEGENNRAITSAGMQTSVKQSPRHDYLIYIIQHLLGGSSQNESCLEFFDRGRNRSTDLNLKFLYRREKNESFQ
jgi:hypothetical protein